MAQSHFRPEPAHHSYSTPHYRHTVLIHPLGHAHIHLCHFLLHTASQLLSQYCHKAAPNPQTPSAVLSGPSTLSHLHCQSNITSVVFFPGMKPYHCSQICTTPRSFASMTDSHYGFEVTTAMHTIFVLKSRYQYSSDIFILPNVVK